MSHGIRAAGWCQQVRLAPDWAPYSRRHVCHDTGRNIIEKKLRCSFLFDYFFQFSHKVQYEKKLKEQLTNEEVK